MLFYVSQAERHGLRNGFWLCIVHDRIILLRLRGWIAARTSAHTISSGRSSCFVLRGCSWDVSLRCPLVMKCRDSRLCEQSTLWQHFRTKSVPTPAMRVMLCHRCCQDQGTNCDHPACCGKAVTHTVSGNAVVEPYCETASDQDES